MADPVKQANARAKRRRISGTTQRSLNAALKKIHVPPKGIMRSYGQFLASAQRQANDLARVTTDQAITLLPVREDAIGDSVLRLFTALRVTTAKLDPAIQIGVQDWGRKTLEFDALKYRSEPMELLNIGPIDAGIEAQFLDSWVAENMALIKGVNSDQIKKLETLVLRGVRDGTRAETLAKEVGNIFDASVSRQRLIARDQVGKLAGQLDRHKQMSAGLAEFTWRTAEDERVRPSHRELNGKTFPWEDPPGVGTPGQPIQCRCTAEPDIEGFLGLDPDDD